MFGLSPAETGGLSVVLFGGWGLAAYFMRLVYTGKLVPASTLERVEHDRDEWRTEGRIKDQIIHEQAEQQRDWLPIGHTAVNLLNALPTPKDGTES